MRKIVLFFLSSLILISCSSSSDIEELNRGNQFVTSYFDSLKKQEYNKVLDFYSDDFYEKISRDKWMAKLKTIQTKLGVFEKSELLQSGKKSPLLGKSKITLLYDSKYSNYSAQETFVLEEHDGKYKIVGHRILSEGLK